VQREGSEELEWKTRRSRAARAEVRSKGKRLASIAVAVRDRGDALIADALVTYKIA
jgi:acyl-coenzyme A thioesterase PaaI-like protein